MSDFWGLGGDAPPDRPPNLRVVPTGESVRKQQITVRLDDGMIDDAREIAARKGIGHHTLLRMWVMEGIIRAYQEGLLEREPRSWNGASQPRERGRGERPSGRSAGASSRRSQQRDPASTKQAGPSGARWLQRNDPRSIS